MKKKLLTAMITAGLILSMSVPTFAAEPEIKSFSDISASYWGYKDIMAMASKGLFSGTGTVVDGVGEFSPNKTMSRAEFVTVVVRALYNDDLKAMPAGDGPWWSNAYTLAVDKGLLGRYELDEGDMAKGMSRQEMALVLVRATEKLGEESPDELVDTSKIADFSTIGEYYMEYVAVAYSMGMLAGTDDKGTYAPYATMNRAQGAAVLNRLIDSSARIKVDFSTPTV